MNLSRADIARLTDSSAAAIQRWETGERKPSLAVLGFYARSVPVSIDVLLAGGDVWTRAFERMPKSQVFDRHKVGISRPPLEIDPVLAPPVPATPDEIRARKLDAIREAERRRDEFKEALRPKRSAQVIRRPDAFVAASSMTAPCRTTRGCPVTQGWCRICQRDAEEMWFERLGRNLIRLSAIRAREEAGED